MAAQIIQFPVQHSNGYNNLIQLFEICDLRFFRILQFLS